MNSPAGLPRMGNAIHFVEAILIDVAIRRGIALDSANGIGSGHGRIIGGAPRKVNAEAASPLSG